MAKNLLTGEKTVISTATVPAEELRRRAGFKVYDDGRKCVYALNSAEVRAGQLSQQLAGRAELWLL